MSTNHDPYANKMTYPTVKRASSGEFSRADHREAMVHALQKSFGLPVRNIHPIAQGVLAGGDYTILDAAESALDLQFGRIPERSGDGFNTLVQALGTADLPAVIQETANGIARERRSDLLPSILALTHQLEVRNYNAESYSFVDLENLPAPSAGTMGEYTFANVRVTGEAIQAFSTFARILVSRQALTNDDRNYIRAAVNAFVAAAHRNEMSMIVSLIESTSNLNDGTPLFHADTANLAVAPLDATGLGTAFSTLRSQATESGDATDATPKTMLVHSDDEAAALALTETLPEGRKPQVVATSRLSNSDSWYLFADAELYPVIGRVRIEGGDLSAVSFDGFEPATRRDPETGEQHDFNGVALPATHSVGFNVLSRVGAVKLTKT